MKIIFRIASHELRGLFISPVAWLLLVAFIIPPGLVFADKLNGFADTLYYWHEFPHLTQKLFFDLRLGVFGAGIRDYLHFFIPLLTMGIVSSELNSGSIKLLYSSPIRVGQIVLGKYLALIGYGAILMFMVGLLVVAGGLSIKDMEIFASLAGLLGLYLLICAYAAIGLFMSCLTSYQVVAAISTLMVLGVLNYIGGVGQQYDVVRDLTYWLSIAGRTNSFTVGLITSKDIIYFLIVIAMFLAFSVMKLRFERETVHPLAKGACYAGVLVAAVTLGYVSSRPALWAFYDTTVNKDQTLTPNSQVILARLKCPLKITTYVNLFDPENGLGMPRARIADLDVFDAYRRFRPDLEMNYVYYYDKTDNPWLYEHNPTLNTVELARREAEHIGMDIGQFLTPEQVRKRIDLTPEGNRLVRAVECGGRETYLRMFADLPGFPLEGEISAALKRLTTRPPKVAFLTGHGERRLDRLADGDYQTAIDKLDYRYSLVNQGFDVITLDLTGRSIPDDVSILVVADPKRPLTGDDTRKILGYLDRGGNALVTAEPGDQPLLNPMLMPLGVQFSEDNILQDNKDFPNDFVLAQLSDSAVKSSDSDAGLFDSRSPVTFHIPGVGSLIFQVKTVSMPGAMGILSEGVGPYTAHPVLVAQATTHPAAKVAVGLTRTLQGREQRLMVVANANFMSNQEIARGTVPASNLSFVLETFRWLAHGEFPVDTNRPESKDNELLVGRRVIAAWRILFTVVIPALLAGLGLVILIRRRRM